MFLKAILGVDLAKIPGKTQKVVTCDYVIYSMSIKQKMYRVKDLPT